MTPTVDARELHEILNTKTPFKDWVVRRIQKTLFKDGQDFSSFLSKTGGRPRKDYHITIEMAKHLAMISVAKRNWRTIRRQSS